MMTLANQLINHFNDKIITTAEKILSYFIKHGISVLIFPLSQILIVL